MEQRIEITTMSIPIKSQLVNSGSDEVLADAGLDDNQEERHRDSVYGINR